MYQVKTMRVKVNGSLKEKIEEVARADGVSRNTWIADALQHQLHLWDVERVREAIVMEEIEREVLIKGQALTVKMGDISDETQCAMCLNEIEKDHRQVEGPFFCETCLAIAKGGNFSELLP